MAKVFCLILLNKLTVMKLLLLIALSAAAVFTSSCKNGSTANAQEKVGQGKNPETETRNTDIPPAFEGQTRIRGLQTQTPYNVQTINNSLGRPWGIINLPDGRFLITEKSGFANIVSNDGKSIKKVTGFPQVDSKGQGGLLDVALDPEFQSNRMVYWTFSEPYAEGNHTSVGKGKLSDDETTIENPVVIFRAFPTYDGDKHYGSRLLFDGEGYIFVSTGERSDKKTRPLAQDPQTYLGKIIKITKEGKPAPGNPIVKGWKPEIYSVGHRNVQGMATDDKGQLWNAEMGPRGGDEINLIEPGKNYGWPVITYGEEYTGLKIGEGIGQKVGMEQPVYFWDPSVSMSGIDFYRGNIPEWKGNLMVGCLSGQKIIRLVIQNNKIIDEEWLLADKNERFRDVLSATDGNLYGITDSGKLYKISKK